MRWLALFCGAAIIPAVLHAQNDASETEEAFELSPFQVDASQDQGYYSSSTMAGGRLSSKLGDVATSVQVVTEEFMEDIASSSIDEILAYTTGTEAVGSMSDYLQVEDSASNGDLDQSRARQNPDSALRVRGLASPTRTTNYFESAIPFNRYTSGRVDINRGANSFLFGLGSPGGIVNTTLDQANLNRNSIEINHRISTENFESNYSNEVSISLNKVLLEDKLAVLRYSTVRLIARTVSRIMVFTLAGEAVWATASGGGIHIIIPSTLVVQVALTNLSCRII
jgi:outer membrane receptor protein involved in Fe transport